MKVYVLLNGSYSDEHIVGVYSSAAHAQLAADIFRDDAKVEEWDVDQGVEVMARGGQPYFVRLAREDGRVLECDVMDRSYGAFTVTVGVDVGKNLYTHCWADSKAHAIKIASERRRVFLALADQPEADPAVPKPVA